MGFHAVALGVVIADHGMDLMSWLQLVAQELILDGKSIDFADNENISEVVAAAKRIKIVLHDDLKTYGHVCSVLEDDMNDDLLYEWMNNEPLLYAHGPIFVGQPHGCTTMIYLGCVGDDCGGEMKQTDISRRTIDQLFKWVDELKQSGRLDAANTLSMVANCCS